MYFCRVLNWEREHSAYCLEFAKSDPSDVMQGKIHKLVL